MDPGTWKGATPWQLGSEVRFPVLVSLSIRQEARVHFPSLRLSVPIRNVRVSGARLPESCLLRLALASCPIRLEASICANTGSDGCGLQTTLSHSPRPPQDQDTVDGLFSFDRKGSRGPERPSDPSGSPANQGGVKGPRSVTRSPSPSPGSAHINNVDGGASPRSR